MVNLVISEGIGKPIAGKFKLTSSVPEFSNVFEGSEKVLATLDLPVYVRRFYLP